jgi:hypothetical protein
MPRRRVDLDCGAHGPTWRRRALACLRCRPVQLDPPSPPPRAQDCRFALIAALIFGWSADVLGGVAAITGAFIAGMGLSRTNERAKHEIEAAVYNLSYMFLVPIFFVHVGLLTNLRQIDLEHPLRDLWWQPLSP